MNDLYQDYMKNSLNGLKRSLGFDPELILNMKKKSKIEFAEFEKKYLSPKQYDVLRDIESNKHSKIIFNGAIGSGKTFLACYFLIKSLITNKKLYSKDTNNFIVGNSIDSITTNTLKQIEKICDLLGIEFVDKKSNNTFCIIDGLILKIYGGKNRDAFYKIRGANTALAYVNEATLMHKETLVEVLRRLRVGQQTVIFDTNPEHPQHYFKVDYVDNQETYKTYNFTIYDNPHLGRDFIATQESIYKDYPECRARFLFGEWTVGDESLFSKMKTVDSYEFKNSICYIDPAFSVGCDNTAVCILEEHKGCFYSFIYQDKKPLSDLTVLTIISKMIKAFYVRTVYIEDRDSIKVTGNVSKEIVKLRSNMSGLFSIRSLKPKSNKYARIMSLLVPISTNQLKVLSQSSKTALSDIYVYRGDGKTNDDALDAMAGAYILQTNKQIMIRSHFVLGRVL